MARCQRIKADGTRCKLAAIGTHGLCYSHDPAKQQERRRTAQRGGRAGGRGRASVELRRLQERFEQLAQRALENTEERGAVAVAVQALAQARACVRDSIMAKEHEGLIAEVEELRRDWEAERHRRRRYGG
jgi:hypothetical protein